RQRREKSLWTDLGRGDPIVIHEAYDEEDEAAFVAREVERLAKEEKVSHRDIAVAYRTNAQSRPLEEAFVRRNIPYRLVGGTRFYERREVKDLLAYLRLVHNPFDSVALLRVINTPPRGIGDKTVQELTRLAREREVPIYSALQLLADAERDTPDGQSGGTIHGFQRRTVGSLLRFLGLLNELMDVAQTSSLSTLVRAVLDKTDYQKQLLQETDGEERMENVMQLLAVTLQYDELTPEHALPAFLEDVSLVTDIDEYDSATEAVTLITLHAAKGLEFPVVLMVGMEEGLLPHSRSLDEPSQMEEERRLCYVGMTRAKHKLYLVRAFRRSFSGHHPPSRFLADIPPDLTQTRERAGASPGWQARSDVYAPRRYSVGEEIALPEVTVEVFEAGDRVSHAKFGEGIVVSAVPSGTDYLVTVAFKGEAGVKKLLLSFAPLQRVES
ncbi:MAG TPA: 3'-5' exonuclease, partial [Dehalococcoidia bacterium]|nr:3'-5' exonuclease [Dehalococcoidia bacterium]